ncbi:phosphoribosylanthranilate isomerase [Kiritimatiellota bacterium B12222]|nr:phosphoribosylanthranilate isomerase [Kiritimatiellota bacterium B12222]
MKGFVKICGLAQADDVEATLALQPDAVGFIFWSKSPRAVSPEQVNMWTQGLVPEGTRKVGVFVDASVDEVNRTAEIAGLDVVQLHGQENADFIHQVDRSVWKALHLDRLPADLADLEVEALLIDSGTVEMPGGTGKQVDMDRAREFISQSRHRVLLAGGLKAGTVEEAILTVRPFGVDVSSGVERIPGQKDMDAVQNFIANARSAFLTL